MKGEQVEQTEAIRVRPSAVSIGLPLALGSMAYLIRPGQTVADGWARILGVGDVLSVARSRSMLAAAGSVPHWFLDALPDAMWSFAVAQTIALIWSRGPSRPRLAWHGLGFALVAGWELGQAFHVVHGTFDVLDLVSSAGAYMLSLFLSTKLISSLVKA